MKFPLSIFNFNTLRIRLISLLTPAATIAVVVFLVLEIILHIVVPEGHHPTGSWHNNELHDQAGQLEAMESVDVMITGSSIAAVNFPPLELEAVFESHGVTKKVFNAGIRGFDYEGIAKGFRTIFWPRKQSAYVLLVVTPVDVNEASKYVRKRTADFIRTVDRPPHAAKAIDLLSHCWIFGFRNEIFEYIKTRTWKHEVSMVTQQGHIDMGFNPRGRYNRKFDIDRSSTTAQALINFCQWLIDQDVKPIVVEGTMDSEARAMVSIEQRRRFDELLSVFEALDNTHRIETKDLIPDDNAFIDQIHLNSDAAKQYARQIAKRLLEHGFPW